MECGREINGVLIGTAGVLILQVVDKTPVPSTITPLNEDYCKGFVTRQCPERNKIFSGDFADILPRGTLFNLEAH